MSDEQRPPGGLLSKVVKFVTNPTTNWADLDRPEVSEDDREAKQALKEMIERKKRNDFVRNREFDMLRKIRRKEALGDSAAAHPSFFNSSEPASSGERAQTLKKIDEIEQQMSRAWFKRQGETTGAASLPPHSLADSLPADAAPVAFAPTVPAEDLKMAEAAAEAPGHVPTVLPMLADEDLHGATAPVASEVVQDPELEESAIRFANGDIAGAEAGLLDLLADTGTRSQHQETWLTLFDLYRATGQQDKFDNAGIDFAARFGRSAPQWFSMPAMMSEPQGDLAAPMVNTVAQWTCPSVVGTQTMAALSAVLTRNTPPWRIDWRHVKTIQPDALPAFIALLDRWAASDARLKFLGAERLEEVLEAQTPLDDANVDQNWWRARLALLRVMGEADEFEVAALGFCVTYELSPPQWEPPRCRYSAMTTEGTTVAAALGPEDESTPATRHPEVRDDGVSGEGAPRLELRGEILGDAEEALKRIEAAARGRELIELACPQLIRVDFGAAGTLLNWVTARQMEGRKVSFDQVNRLVAAFFGVIGISEVARVTPRRD